MENLSLSEIEDYLKEKKEAVKKEERKQKQKDTHMRWRERQKQNNGEEYRKKLARSDVKSKCKKYGWTVDFHEEE